MARTLGLGTVLSMDDDDSGSVFTTITLAVTAKPPGRERALIDGQTLGDTLATYVPGIELHSAYEFEVDWEPNDAQHVIFGTLFGAKTQIKWVITFASTDILTFEGVLTKMEPQGITVDGLLRETYTIQRMTANVYT